MHLINHILTFLVLTTSAFSYADNCNCLQSDDAYQLYCDRIASDMRVNLRALESLDKNAPIQAKDAITWLEQALKMDEIALKN
jgi:hypothetical protein